MVTGCEFKTGGYCDLKWLMPAQILCYVVSAQGHPHPYLKHLYKLLWICWYSHELFFNERFHPSSASPSKGHAPSSFNNWATTPGFFTGVIGGKSAEESWCDSGVYRWWKEECLVRHLKVNCGIKKYPSKVYISPVHWFIIITEFIYTFFLYPATYLSCFRLKYMPC